MALTASSAAPFLTGARCWFRLVVGWGFVQAVLPVFDGRSLASRFRLFHPHDVDREGSRSVRCFRCIRGGETRVTALAVDAVLADDRTIHLSLKANYLRSLYLEGLRDERGARLLAQLAPALPSMPNLRLLKIHAHGLSDGSLLPLIEAFARTPQLVRIAIGGCITDAEITALAAAIRANPNWEELAFYPAHWPSRARVNDLLAGAVSLGKPFRFFPVGPSAAMLTEPGLGEAAKTRRGIYRI